MPGYPIRTPWDHSSVDSSPRPIAASHVLHRLLMPRHPPYAHSNLTTQTQRPKKKDQTPTRSQQTSKMLASTVQFSTNTKPPPHPATHPDQPRQYHDSRDPPKQPHPD